MVRQVVDAQRKLTFLMHQIFLIVKDAEKDGSNKAVARLCSLLEAMAEICDRDLVEEDDNGQR